VMMCLTDLRVVSQHIPTSLKGLWAADSPSRLIPLVAKTVRSGFGQMRGTYGCLKHQSPGPKALTMQPAVLCTHGTRGCLCWGSSSRDPGGAGSSCEASVHAGGEKPRSGRNGKKNVWVLPHFIIFPPGDS